MRLIFHLLEFRDKCDGKEFLKYSGLVYFSFFFFNNYIVDRTGDPPVAPWRRETP